MTYKKGQRDAVVAKMRGEGKTQLQIAQKMGVTRQWVQQIEKRLFPEGRQGIRRAPQRYTFTCKQCGTKGLASVKSRLFCGRACFFVSRRKTFSPKEILRREKVRREKARVRARVYYHDVLKTRPGWRDKIREWNQRYARIR